MYVLGGTLDGGSILDDLWRLDLETFTWHQDRDTLGSWQVQAEAEAEAGQ